MDSPTILSGVTPGFSWDLGLIKYLFSYLYNLLWLLPCGRTVMKHIYCILAVFPEFFLVNEMLSSVFKECSLELCMCLTLRHSATIFCLCNPVRYFSMLI